MMLTTIGRYELKKELGRGGMAVVYLANDPVFEREVAVKVLPRGVLDDVQFRTRFEREARFIAAVEHNAIVPVYDFGEQDGQPYLVMRYMAGGSLHDRLQHGPLSLVETSEILQRIGSALDNAHRRGIVHRDLKPGNILFDEAGEAYLTDFGIAKQMASTMTLTGSMILGTPAYMSPEQARGDSTIDFHTDIYSLGTIVFEMLTGRVPYEADSPTGQMLRHITDPVPDILLVRKDLPVEIQKIIERAMAKRPEARFAMAGELSRAVKELVQPKKPVVPAPKPTPVVSGVVTQQSVEKPQAVGGQLPKKKSRLWIAALPILFILLMGICFGGGTLISRLIRAIRAGTTVNATSTLAKPLGLGSTPSLASVGYARLMEAQGGDLYTGSDESNPTPVSNGTMILAGTDTRLWTREATSKLKLSNEAVVYLGQNTAVWLVSVTGTGSAANSTLLKIEKGSVLSDSTSIVIQAYRDQFQAEGIYAILGLTYEANRGRFLADCISGTCKVGTLDKQDARLIPINQRGGFENGELIGFQPAAEGTWMALSGETLAWPSETATGLAEATTEVPVTDLSTATASSMEDTATPTITPSPTRTPTPVVVVPTNTRRPPTKQPSTKASPTKPPPTKPPTRPPP